MNDFRPGDRLCHCTLIDRCGSGSYGEVFLAEDEIGARVAIKIVPNGGRYSEREIAGLRHYRDCNHPNLLKIRHIEITPEYVVYTMDAADDLHHGQGKYLPDTLANRLRLRKRLDGVEIETMLAGVLSGLEELHGKNLVHRDIKPDNILYVNGRPTLADAGLIVPSGQGSLVGTPGFLSPRLLAGKARAEAQDDFYALGKVIYCALTGNPVEEYPSLPRDMTLSGNADWGKIFRTMCEGTIASAAEFRDFLQGVRAGTVSHGRKRRARKWIFIAVAVLLAAAAVVSFLFRRDKTPVAPIAPPYVSPPVMPEKSPAATAPQTLVEDIQKRVAPFADPVGRREYTQNEDISSVSRILRDAGYFDTDKMRDMLSLHSLTNKNFISRLLFEEGIPRMVHGSKKIFRHGKVPTSVEREIAEACRDYREGEMGIKSSRQYDWATESGKPLDIQRKMLSEDTVMQGIALDLLIREKIDEALAAGKISEKEKDDLQTWVALRNTLIDEKTKKFQNPATKSRSGGE